MLGHSEVSWLRPTRSAIIIGGSWKTDLERRLADLGLTEAFEVVSSLADFALGVTIDRDGSYRLCASELYDRLVINMLPTCFVGETMSSTFEQSEVNATHWLVLTHLNRPPLNALDIESGRVHSLDLTSVLGQRNGFAVDGIAFMQSAPDQLLPCQATGKRVGRIRNGMLLPPTPPDILECHDNDLVRIARLILRDCEISS
jgi:hypothetical protein